MKIEFKRLTEVKKSDIIELMNNHLVRRQLPLLVGEFNETECKKFIRSKEEHWDKYGFGLWAFVINGKFIGWGGLQTEEGDADIALVLHPNYWGTGKIIYKKIMNNAFYDLELESVTILFPPSRTRINGLLKLGFKKETELKIINEKFIKYRITKNEYNEY